MKSHLGKERGKKKRKKKKEHARDLNLAEWLIMIIQLVLSEGFLFPVVQLRTLSSLEIAEIIAFSFRLY